MAQKGVQYEDDEQFEIADFRSTLNKCIEEDENKIYGRKNKPRQQEPSMFQLLSWQEKDGALWDYTKKDKNVIEANVANQLKYRINKSNSHWVTENMDQFRKFTYSPSKKGVFFDLEEPSKTKPSPQKDAISEYAHSIGKSGKDQGIYVKELPKKASETLDKYAIKDIKNLKDVLKVIENRAIDKGGDVIANPIAEQLTDHYGYEDEFARENGEYRGTDEEGEEQDQDEDSSDDGVKVDKANYTNVQSRLLTNKVRKAKELDPVYEKDRLKRRTDRIQRLNETTRWLPNSAFKTYFGKPPFENYGRGNVNPTVGGSIYGDYMKSHNINPHAGDNKPEFKQIFDRAELAATTYPSNEPEPPRKCKDEHRLSQKQVDELKRRNPLVPEKFSVSSKNIIKPDLVNSMRFASEENTPEGSVDEKEKSSKPKNLAEAFKNLSKTTKAIRKEIAKNSPTKSGKSKKSKSKGKMKKQELLYRQLQEQLKSDREKAAAAKKEAKEAAAAAPATTTKQQEPAKRAQPQSESKLAKTQPRTSEKPSKSQAREERNARDERDDFEYSRATRPQTAQTLQPGQLRGKSNDSKSVKELMNDPATAFTPNKKEVSFKQDAKSASKYKEAPPAQQNPRASVHEYGKVEHLSTMLKETQKNEKLWNKINEDMNGTLNVDAMNPPKNYLASLAQKEVDPRYYKNVPHVWTNRIPYAGKKVEKNDDIRGVFNYSD